MNAPKHKIGLTVISALVAAALVGFSGAPRAKAVDTLLSGFNGTLATSLGVDWQVVDAGWHVAFVPQLSEGTGALRAYANPNWSFGLKLSGGPALAQLIVNNDTLELDAVTPYGINYRQVAFIMNNNISGFVANQTEEIGISYPTEANPFTHVTVNMADAKRTAPGTVNWKANAQQWLDSPRINPEWFELMIVLNGNDNAYSADFDFNQGVEGQDFATWQRNFGSLEAGPEQGDATGDFAVNGADLQQWSEQFGRYQIDPYATIDNIKFVKNTVAAAVPEPATLAGGLLGAVFVACGARRRRRRS